MEDRYWNSLFEELCSEFVILNQDNEVIVSSVGKRPISRYNIFIWAHANTFIGECRRNIEKHGGVPEYFKDLLFKLDHLFLNHFGINFPQGKIPFPLKHGDYIIPAENRDKDPFITVIKSKIDAFELAILYLRDQLNSKPQIVKKRRKRQKAEIGDFGCNLTPAHLSQILKVGKRLEFFSNETDQLNFINTFTLRAPKTPINWTCTVYSLNRFFKGINGNIINKINDGKWDVVSELFLVNDKRITPESLMNPSKGEHDQLNDLNILLDVFNDSDNFQV